MPSTSFDFIADMATHDMSGLPDSGSPNLHLDHPTASERLKLLTWDWQEWSDGGHPTLPQHIEHELFVETIPLARDGGLTLWILVDKHLPPDPRPILSSCDSFRKRAFISRPGGEYNEGVIHRINGVFTDPACRRRGYASRMMKELSQMLRTWQSKPGECFGSVLNSGIGRDFYARAGWLPSPSGVEIELSPLATAKPTLARPLLAEDLPQLCKDDEDLIHQRVGRSCDGRTRMITVPDLDQILWYHESNDHICRNQFGKQTPHVKGAIVGEPGNRVCAIWTHQYYGEPGSLAAENILLVLRLVIEGEATINNADLHHLQTEHLRAILTSAQAEAADWLLTSVEIRDPSPLTEHLIEQTGIPHRKTDGADRGVASLLWFSEGGGKDVIDWVANEHYAWVEY